MSTLWEKFKKWWKEALIATGIVGVALAATTTAPVSPQIGDALGFKDIGRVNGAVSVKYAYIGAEMDETLASAGVAKKHAQAQRIKITREVVSRRTPSARIFETDKPEKFVGEFVTGFPQYYKDADGKWWQAEYATTTKANFNRPNSIPKSPQYKVKHGLTYNPFVRIAYAASQDFFPDPDPETNTTDGTRRAKSGHCSGGDDSCAQTDWNLAHDAASAGDVGLPGRFGSAAGNFGGDDNLIIIRLAMYFNTGGTIDSFDTIDSATVSLYFTSIHSNNFNDGDDFIAIVQTQGNSVSSDTDFANADFDLVGDAIDNPTEGHASGQRKDFGSITTGQYTDFTLNSTGEGWIAKSGESSPAGGTAGITYLGAREGHDIKDNYPAGLNGSPNGEGNRIVASLAEASGTSQDPKLSVTWTDGAAPTSTPARQSVIFFD